MYMLTEIIQDSKRHWWHMREKGEFQGPWSCSIHIESLPLDDSMNSSTKEILKKKYIYIYTDSDILVDTVMGRI